MIISFTIITLALLALCCFLAAKFHYVDKAYDKISDVAESLVPLSLENITDALISKGCVIDATDEKEQHISFTYNELKYHTDISRKPFVFLHTGFGLDEDADIDCVRMAASQIGDDIIMVKGNAYEDGYGFNIASCDQTIGNFTASFDRYMDIFNDAIRHFGELYHEYLGEKHGREQAIDQMQNNMKSASSKTMENKILS